MELNRLLYIAAVLLVVVLVFRVIGAVTGLLFRLALIAVLVMLAVALFNRYLAQ